MSLDQITREILLLGDDDKRRFAGWFEENRNSFLATDINETADLFEKQWQELEHRAKAVDANPDLLIPWEGAKARQTERLRELRREDSSAG